jgi:hypothetical protein
MSWLAEASLWLAVVLTGLAAGTIASRWNDQPGAVSRAAELLLLAGAAAAVVAWCAHAGTLLSGGVNVLLDVHVPISVGPIFRLAVLWATLAGASLTFGTIMLVRLVLSGSGTRVALFSSGMAFVALGISLWFMPRTGDVVADAVPPFAVSGPAALAPLFALVALVTLAWIVANSPAGPAAPPRTALIGAWVLATAAVATEQMARSQLGIGPRESVVLGAASSGLFLWLVCSALLHSRIQQFVLRTSKLATRNDLSTHAAWTGHAGAIFLAVSFAAHAFAERSTVSLPPGTAVTVNDGFQRPWQLVNQGVSRFDAEGVDVTAVAIEARDPRGAPRLLTPEIREYHGRDGQHMTAGVAIRASTGRITQAMRVLLSPPDSLDVASVRVTFLPAPVLWPVGVVLLGLSATLALMASPPRSPSS